MAFLHFLEQDEDINVKWSGIPWEGTDEAFEFEAFEVRFPGFPLRGLDEAPSDGSKDDRPLWLSSKRDGEKKLQV